MKISEKEMGVILIERKKEGVVLTEDGKRLINAIRSIYIAEIRLKRQNASFWDLKAA